MPTFSVVECSNERVRVERAKDSLTEAQWLQLEYWWRYR